jgi:hypothetical protein
MEWIMLTKYPYRTLVYVEGEASLSTYTDPEDKQEKPRTSLNIVQRK